MVPQREETQKARHIHTRGQRTSSCALLPPVRFPFLKFPREQQQLETQRTSPANIQMLHLKCNISFWIPKAQGHFIKQNTTALPPRVLKASDANTVQKPCFPVSFGPKHTPNCELSRTENVTCIQQPTVQHTLLTLQEKRNEDKVSLKSSRANKKPHSSVSSFPSQMPCYGAAGSRVTKDGPFP